MNRSEHLSPRVLRVARGVAVVARQEAATAYAAATVLSIQVFGHPVKAPRTGGPDRRVEPLYATGGPT